jgi:predicted transcriptional regulator
MFERLKEYAPITISELSRTLGYSKSMVYNRVKKLEKEGLVKIKNQGGVSIIEIIEKKNPMLYVGILRASEYPYIIDFAKKLEDKYKYVQIKVYDDAFKETVDLSLGKIQLAMSPAISLMSIHRISKGEVFIIGGGSGGGSGIINNPNGNEGHTTSMMSSMELCAEIHKVEMPRLYSSSGKEILENVEKGRVRYGIVWEPYLTLAKRKQMKTIPCQLDTCCLLGAHKSLYDDFDKIKKMLSDSISRINNANLETYSDIIMMPKEIVKDSIKSYSFFEEPDKNYLKNILSNMRNVILPENIVSQAII